MCRELEAPEWGQDMKDQLAASNAASAARAVTVKPDFLPYEAYESGGMTCARCDQATGNNHQGHYWSMCSKERKLIGFHFCCPGLECEPDG